jgi:outer membrane protein OmpA-like peptidoglycan-associated protein
MMDSVRMAQHVKPGQSERSAKSILVRLVAVPLLSLACALACASSDGGSGPDRSAAAPAPVAPPKPVDPKGLTTSVKFDAGSNWLSDGARTDLEALALQLAPFPDHAVHITGYADGSNASAGVKKDRWLPERRAKRVGAYLVSRGVAANHVTIEGQQPSAENGDSTITASTPPEGVAEVLVR